MVVQSGNNNPSNFVFDKSTGNFLVTVKMTPEESGIFAQQQNIADVNKLVFDKTSGLFFVPVYLMPEEYGQYAQDQVLPSRLYTYAFKQ